MAKASDSNRKELIAQGLRKKKECEDRASSIIERLIEPHQDREWLRESCNFLTQAHFDDVVAERGIVKICGFPLCSNTLGPRKAQKYRINSKTQTVIELSESENFCSRKCLLNSNAVKSQILTTPLWLRDEKDRIGIVFHDEVAKEVEEPKPSKNAETESVSNVRKTSKKALTKKSQKHVIEREESQIEIVTKTLREWWTNDSSAFILGREIDLLVEGPPQQDVELEIPIDSESLAKVQAFYKGSMDISKEIIIKETDTNQREPVIPLVDKKSRRLMQRNIALQGLEKGVTSVAEITGVNWSEISMILRDFVSTFQLSASNIVLRSSTWMLMSNFLLIALSRREESLRQQLETPTCRRFHEQLFSGVEYALTDVSLFIDGLMQLDKRRK